jgi:hypothetical protein
LTGFNIDWIDGVMGEDIPNNALPPVRSLEHDYAPHTYRFGNQGMDRGILPEPNIGSWRGHMNAVRRCVAAALSKV